MGDKHSLEYEVKRDDKTINDLLNRLADAVNEGVRKYPSMSYEQGQQDMFNWLTDAYGKPDEKPPY